MRLELGPIVIVGVTLKVGAPLDDENLKVA